MRQYHSVVVLAITFVAFCNHVTAKKPTPQVDLANDLLRMCSGSNPIASARQKKELTWLVEASGKPSLVLSTSPQHQAACWVLYQDRKQSKGRGRDLFLQRYALATLHFATTKTNTTVWDWRMTVDEPWAEPVRGRWMSTRHHECDWYGVNCAMFGKQVKRLILGYMKLDGIIPREIYLLPKLKELDLHGNDFQGVLPLKMVDALHNLEYLYLHMNGFFGSLHREIKGLKSLRELRIFGNYFAGSIPGPEIASLKNLQIIDLYANFLTGTIPTELGSLKKLRSLDLHDNNLVGTVPKQICDLKLDELIVDCLGPKPEVQCSCCTVCCRGLPDAKCVDVKTGMTL